jgi:hypothetical protein
MNSRITGYLVLGLGVFIIVFSLTVDYIGFGKKGFQAAQIFGIQAGVVLVLFGWLIAKHLTQLFVNYSFYLRKLKERLTLASPLSLAVIGFIFVYVWLFVPPMFLNPDHRIQYFSHYLPDRSPIGTDLVSATKSISGWLSGQSLYDRQGLYYPPLYAAIFSPTLLLKYPSNYYLVTFLTLASMVIIFLQSLNWQSIQRKTDPC